MQDPSFQVLMIALALATPVLAGLIHVYAKTGALSSIRKGRLLLLALAGPVNLMISILMSPHREKSGAMSWIGISLAAAVFITVGFGFGFLQRMAESLA